jgi:hypothetical protein
MDAISWLHAALAVAARLARDVVFTIPSPSMKTVSPTRQTGIDTLTTFTCEYRWPAHSRSQQINRLPWSPTIRNGFQNAYTELTCQSLY